MTYGLFTFHITADVCSLPKERGPCHSFSVKWYFDVTYGGCSRFWYGGCDGNGNQFNSQEECEGVCVTPEGPGKYIKKKMKNLYFLISTH